MIKDAEEMKTKEYFTGKRDFGKYMPVPTKKAANKEGFGKNTEVALVEWEKNQIKPLYKEYDKDKKGITKENLIEIMQKLAKDECIIGKVPAENQIPEDYFDELFTKESENGPVTWEYFRENLVNMFPWKMVDREQLEETVENFFALSYKYKMQGKDTESKEMATKALRLQGSLTKAKPIEIDAGKGEGTVRRGDIYNRTVFRRTDNVHPDDVPADKIKDFTMDKTKTFNFKC